jgi:hypothetical protein
MTTYLACRTTKPKGFFRVLFASYTKWKLQTQYPHAGIVKDGVLYHANFAHDMMKEPFHPEGWDLYPIDDKDVEALFEKHKTAKYDWFSLLAFVFPFRFTKAKWLYCFEWCYIVMTGELPRGRVTAEMLIVMAFKRKLA